MTRLSLVYALGCLLLLASRASAVVEAEMPLAQLAKDSQLIAIARLEQVDKEKGRGSLVIERILQGEGLPANIAVKLVPQEKGEGSPNDMLERVTDDMTLVLFLSSLKADEHQAFAYSNGSWFKLRGIDELARLKLVFVQGEPYLRRTFHGAEDELVTLLDDHVAGKGALPGLDKSAKPGLGPRLDDAAPLPEPLTVSPNQIELGPAWQTEGHAASASSASTGNYAVAAILLAATLCLVLMLTRSSPGASS